MVGRLVEHQKVVVLLGQLEQRQPRPLAAGEHPDQLVVAQVRKHIGAQQVVGLGVLLDVGAGLKVQGAVFLDAAQLLVVIAHRDAGSGARVGPCVVAGAQAQQRPQEGGFTRAVAPDQRHAFAAPDLHRHVAEQRAPGQLFGQMFGVEHHVAAGRGVKQDPGGALGPRRGLGGALLQALQTGFHAAGAAGQLGHTQPPDLHAGGGLSQAGDLPGVLGGAGAGALYFLVQRGAEGGVAAGVDIHLAAPQVGRLVGGGVQKGPVVADDQRRTWVAGHEALQPLDHHDIEVVGGLVEQQHIGVFDDQGGQAQAGALTARQASRQVVLAAPEAEGQRHGVAATAALETAPAPVVLQQLGVVLDALRALHHPGGGVQLGLQGVEFVKGGLQHAVHGAAGRERRVLGQVAHPHAGAAPDHARVGFLAAEQQPQQGRLPGAVAPHQPDAVAGVDLQTHAREHRLSAVIFLNVLQGQQHAWEYGTAIAGHTAAPTGLL